MKSFKYDINLKKEEKCKNNYDYYSNNGCGNASPVNNGCNNNNSTNNNTTNNNNANNACNTGCNTGGGNSGFNKGCNNNMNNNMNSNMNGNYNSGYNSNYNNASCNSACNNTNGCSNTNNAANNSGYKKTASSCSTSCDLVQGNLVELELSDDDCEVKVDVTVDTIKIVRLWGQVKDCEGSPIKHALVKLVKAYLEHGRVKYEGVAHTVSDCLGFYQFDICPDNDGCAEKFLLIVSKPAIGSERVVIDSEKCNPCCDDLL